MHFSDKSFAERSDMMGDLAENAFRRFADSRGIRQYNYGLNRPPFDYFANLPDMVKATPDFICESQKRTKFFVECKGTGGKVIKIKHESLAALEAWNDLMMVWFFFYDSNNDRYAFVNYRHLLVLCEDARSYQFPDNNKFYYSLRTSKLTWEDMPKEYTNE